MPANDSGAPRPAAPLSHHELCFGCGTANLFGLQMELERTADGVAGRFFVKQDHQGPPGVAHGGAIAAALEEAMALAAREHAAQATTARLEVDLRAPAPVGTFVRVEAAVERRDGDRIEAVASARMAGARPATVADARAVLLSAAPTAAAPDGAPGGDGAPALAPGAGATAR